MGNRMMMVVLPALVATALMAPDMVRAGDRAGGDHTPTDCNSLCRRWMGLGEPASAAPGPVIDLHPALAADVLVPAPLAVRSVPLTAAPAPRRAAVPVPPERRMVQRHGTTRSASAVTPLPRRRPTEVRAEPPLAVARLAETPPAPMIETPVVPEPPAPTVALEQTSVTTVAVATSAESVASEAPQPDIWSGARASTHRPVMAGVAVVHVDIAHADVTYPPAPARPSSQDAARPRQAARLTGFPPAFDVIAAVMLDPRTDLVTR